MPKDPSKEHLVELTPNRLDRDLYKESIGNDSQPTKEAAPVVQEEEPEIKKDLGPLYAIHIPEAPTYVLPPEKPDWKDSIMKRNLSSNPVKTEDQELPLGLKVFLY